jgi:hypothetical protein
VHLRPFAKSQVLQRSQCPLYLEYDIEEMHDVRQIECRPYFSEPFLNDMGRSIQPQAQPKTAPMKVDLLCNTVRAEASKSHNGARRLNRPAITCCTPDLSPMPTFFEHEYVKRYPFHKRHTFLTHACESLILKTSPAYRDGSV